MLQITKPQSNEYTKQADKFLTDTNTTVKIEYLKHGKHFDDDQTRDIYKITISRSGRKFSFEFGNSIVDSGIIAVLYDKRLDGKLFKHNGKIATLAQNLVDAKYRSWNLKNCKALTPRVSPSSYSVLACLTKYDCGTFENFCSEFGYDIDSRKAKKVYKAVCKEWKNVQSIWTDDEIEQLQEIS